VKAFAAVIDTNVVVSGLLTSEPKAPTRLILDHMITGEFEFLLSQELLAEYREVLLRPKVRRLHKLGEHEVEAILVNIVAKGLVRHPSESFEPFPDPGGSHLAALMAAEPGAVLVTGDGDLLDMPSAPGTVLTPRQFLAMLRE
jgi:putative PIN family toxin of toxin-antitoxin system